MGVVDAEKRIGQRAAEKGEQGLERHLFVTLFGEHLAARIDLSSGRNAVGEYALYEATLFGKRVPGIVVHGLLHDSSAGSGPVPKVEDGELQFMSDLRDKRVVISGASSGIGFETASRLAEEGAEVCLVARDHNRLQAAVDTIGGAAWQVCCDLADPVAVAALAEAVGSRWPAVDGLVNNAGIAPMATVDDTTTEVWDTTFAVNVRGPFLLCRELSPLLHAGTSPAVVNVSSTLAERAIPGMAAYNASKAALNQLTRSLALEWAPSVRVNAVMPAVVDTPIHALRGMTSEQVHEMDGIHPLGRIGQPKDVAALILFLLSEASSWMTGAVIPVDGGVMAS